jgi:hypothetical protein
MASIRVSIDYNSCDPASKVEIFLWVRGNYIALTREQFNDLVKGVLGARYLLDNTDTADKSF